MTDDGIPIESGDLPGGAEAAAAEYVLGLLPEDERVAFERQIGSDADLEQDVAAWAEYFARFTDPVEEVPPPPQVLRRIESALFAETKVPFWRHLLPYLLGAVAAAALAAVVVMTGLIGPGQQPHLYADLVDDDRGLVLLAHWAPDSETFMVRRDDGTVPQDVSYQIWVIPDSGDGAAPVSVGLITQDQLTEIPVPDALIPIMTGGAVVAISEEPLGGSPTGAPTGPVLAVGALDVRE